MKYTNEAAAERLCRPGLALVLALMNSSRPTYSLPLTTGLSNTHVLATVRSFGYIDRAISMTAVEIRGNPLPPQGQSSRQPQPPSS